MAFRGDRVVDIALVDWGQGAIWCEDDGDQWLIVSRGRCPKRSTDNVIETRNGVTVRDWEDAEDERADAERVTEEERIRMAVLEQCNGNMLDLVHEGEVVASVPLVPFVVWCLESTVLSGFAPPWRTVSRSGAYLQGDSGAHSDWWFGAGLGDKAGWYKSHDSPVHTAAMRMMSRVQKVIGGFRCAVIVGGEAVYGVVGRDVAVVPDLHPDRIDEIVRCKAVVTEAGGAVAHLANVARERSIPMLRSRVPWRSSLGACG